MSKKDSAELLADMLALLPSKAYIAVTRAYNVTVSPSWGFEKRCIDEFHMMYVRGGNGWYVIDGRRYAFSPGKVFFLFPRTEYSGFHGRGVLPSIIPLRFEMRTSGADSLIRTPQLQPIVFTPAKRIVYQECFESVYDSFVRSQTVKHAAGTSAAQVHILMSMIGDELGTHARGMQRLSAIHRFIDRHPAARVSVESLAGRVRMPVKRFTRAFERAYGVMPKSYIMSARMRYARYLLENTNDSIYEIARLLQYPDQYIFSKQFKAFYGITPSSLR